MFRTTFAVTGDLFHLT